MDHEKPSACGVTTRPKHENICSRTARSGKMPAEGWSEKKPVGAKNLGALRPREMQQGDPRLTGNSGSWKDSGPTGGGAARPRSGRRENARNTLRRKRGRWERGRKIRGRYLSSSFSFYSICQASKGGGGGTRRPCRDGDLRRICSVGKRFCNCCHDLPTYIGRMHDAEEAELAEVEEQAE